MQIQTGNSSSSLPTAAGNGGGYLANSLPEVSIWKALGCGSNNKITLKLPRSWTPRRVLPWVLAVTIVLAIAGVLYAFWGNVERMWMTWPSEDLCSPNPCQNGGTCEIWDGGDHDDGYFNSSEDLQDEDGLDESVSDSFQCICLDGWIGVLCQIPEYTDSSD